ncbi:MAG: branched-chain amino acid ABC transporter permease [Clostridiales bacterium]|jgi:branched-chain amino acid transport system permease protein|nr:branched-chain amino acid ABC transporter permease [Clostridiales bacterium]
MAGLLKNDYLKAVAPRPPAGFTALSRLKKFFAQPANQFLILGALMLVLFLLNKINSNLVPSSIINAVATTFIYATVAIGFCLLLGYSGLASLGTAGFIGIGCYTGFYMMEQAGATYLVALLTALAISLALGIVVGFISLRIEGIYLAILTLGLSEILRNLLMALSSTIKISLANIKLFGVKVDDKQVFLLIVFMFVVLLILTGNLIKSPAGRAMLAMKNSTSAAQAMGISLMKYRLLAFVISTVYAAVGGLMYVMLIPNITTSTSQLFTLATSLNILAAVIIGGSKSLWGTLAGTFIIYGLNATVLNRIAFFSKNPAIIVIVTGLLLILVVMFYPGGLAQMVKGARAFIKRKAAAIRRRRYGDED